MNPVSYLWKTARQLFIRTQIAIPTERKHRYLQRKERYEESLKYLLLINASNSWRFLVAPKFEFYIASGVCVSVQSRLANLTGSYHATQVFHTSSCQLNYIRMLDEINNSHLWWRNTNLKLCTKAVHLLRTATKSICDVLLTISSHNCKYFLKPTFIYVHIGQDGIIVLILYCLHSLSLFNDKSTRQDYCILILHNKASNTHSSDIFYQAPDIPRQHIWD